MRSRLRAVKTRAFQTIRGVSNGPVQLFEGHLKVLAKFGLCSNCSQKLNELSLARARKIRATARVLGFLLKCPAV